jgi:hypothetical protein
MVNTAVTASPWVGSQLAPTRESIDAQASGPTHLTALTDQDRGATVEQATIEHHII